ncbi:putative CRISPR-associated protein [Desulfurispora thermophila]|uniref:putative CRISPR-associated protein n=1 Tax=Desulfurispora thermophila TaxID=265470 RepID=UPI001FA73F7E|nr:putative CRISPR-associated protein [Desulfurispora thermophila]
MLTGWASGRPEASAEITSLWKIKQETGQDIAASLIATDTILSRLAAEIIEKVLQGQFKVFFEPVLDVIPGLQVKDRKKFEKTGLVELLERIEKIIFSRAGGDYGQVGLNITGGYKAVIPYLTILGQVKGIPLYYIFERTDELIKLPQAPLSINWSMFEKYSHVLNDLAEGIAEDWQNYKRKHNIGDDFSACIWEEGDMAELNALGRVFWLKYQQFITVDILRGMRYFSDSAGNKAEVNVAIKELYGRLQERLKDLRPPDEKTLLQYLSNLPDTDDLRHGANPGRNKFIFKSTKKSHIRLFYSPVYQNGFLKLKIYDYVRGDFDHEIYIQEFKRRLKALPDEQFITIPL